LAEEPSAVSFHLHAITVLAGKTQGLCIGPGLGYPSPHLV
jgi:hypothetical protein